MYWRHYILMLASVVVHQSSVHGITTLLLNTPVYRLSPSTVNTDSAFKFWTSRSFLNCVIECSQDSTCQSIFYDRTTKLCYWNNNIIVPSSTTTSGGTIQYFQLYSNVSSVIAMTEEVDLTKTMSTTVDADDSTTINIPEQAADTKTIGSTHEAADNTNIIITEEAAEETSITTTLSTTTLKTRAAVHHNDGFVTLPVSGITVYFGTSSKTNKPGAESECDWINARLVVVDSAEKQEDLKTYMSNLNFQGSFYIGLEEVSSGWQWSDGSSLDYSAWASEPPLSYCAAITSDLDYKWEKVWCKPSLLDYKYYICERV